MELPEEFFSAYVATALWSSGDEFDGYGADDIAEETIAAMRADCAAFYAANADDLNCEHASGPDFGPLGRAGHDFWLTRNHHGAGFWDGDWPEPQATRLTKAAHSFGECNLYIGDDNLLYVE